MGEPSDQAFPRLLGELELNRLLSLLLNDCRAMPCSGVHDELSNAQLHEITTAQLAMDGEVKQGKVPDPALPLRRSLGDRLAGNVRSTTRLLRRGIAAEWMWEQRSERPGPQDEPLSRSGAFGA